MGCLIFEMKNVKNNGIYILIVKNDFGLDDKMVKVDFMVGLVVVSGE